MQTVWESCCRVICNGQSFFVLTQSMPLIKWQLIICTKRSSMPISRDGCGKRKWLPIIGWGCVYAYWKPFTNSISYFHCFFQGNYNDFCHYCCWWSWWWWRWCCKQTLFTLFLIFEILFALCAILLVFLFFLYFCWLYKIRVSLPTGTFLLHPLFDCTTCSCNFYFICHFHFISDDDVYFIHKIETTTKKQNFSINIQMIRLCRFLYMTMIDLHCI